MNRRGFLGFLGGLAATAAIDPEKLLWEPGKRLISIPSTKILKPYLGLEIGDIITIAGRYIVNPTTRKSTEQLRHFVVTSRIDFLEGPPSGSIFPPLIDRGQFQNVTIAPYTVFDPHTMIRKIVPPELFKIGVSVTVDHAAVCGGD